MKKKQKKINVRKLLVPMLLLVFLFSCIKAGVALASSDSFVIESAEITDKSETVEVNSFSYEKCKITNDIVFHKVGDSVTYKVKVRNNDDVNYTIKSVSDDNENAYIAYLYDSYEGTKIEAKGEVTFEITEKYANAIADMSKRNQKNIVDISFTLEDENGNVIDKNISVNPKTGDNAGKYVTMSIASLIMLLFLLNKKGVKATRNVRKRSNVARISKVKQVKQRSTTKHYGKHSGRGFKTFGLFLAMMLTIPVISKAVGTSTLVVTFENNISLKDKLIVTYNIDDEQYERIVNYNEPIENLENPEMQGYDFDGWKTEDGEPFDPTEPIKDDVTINAKLTPITYRIEYDLDGGTVTPENPTTYTIETNDIELTKPEKTGHTFTGWTGTDLTGKVKNVIIAKGSIGNREYTANWQIDTYTITLDLNGGTGETSVTREYGDEVGTLPEPTKEGYDFDGWKDDNGNEVTENTIVTGEMEVHANWTPINYTITYTGLTDEEKTALNNPTTYNIETPSFTLNNPQDRRDSDNDLTQRFVGWKEVSTSISITIPPVGLGNKIYEAIWVDVDPDTYTITYNLNGGTVSPDNRTSFTKHDTFTLNNPIKTGYTFAGWTGSNGTTPQTTVTIPTGIREDLSYIANWTPINYSITYDLDDGTATGNPDSYTIESNNITLNNPTKTGYTFKGWTGTGLQDKTMEVTIPTGSTGDKEYTANFEANTYEIVFDRNTGAGSMANEDMVYDVTKPLIANAFTKEGYHFNGWNTKADGTGTSYSNQDRVKNLASEQGAEVTLYAQWEANQYNVIFNKNNDDATGTMNPQTLTYDQAEALTENGYTLEHYKFMGWNSEANGLGVHYEDEAEVINLSTEADVTLYAEWKELTSTLQTGSDVNTILKGINSNATTFTHYTGTPNLDALDGKQDIATTNSNFPVWAWADGDTIYWWSEAEKPDMSSNSDEMFKSTQFTSVDLSGFNTTTATTLRSMFAGSYAENINFGDGDFTNVSDMSGMFEATKVTTLDLSGIKTSTTLNTVSRMFAESYNLTSITFGDNFDTSGVTIFSEMFRGAGSLANIDGVEDFDTSSAIKMNGMFWNNKVTSLDLTGWDVSDVTTIEHLFRGCSKLKSLDVSNWNVSNVTNMSDVFGCSVLENLDLSQWTNSKVKTMDYMFQGGKYTELDLSGFDTSNVTNMGYMFNETGSIETVYVSEDFVINTDQAMFINNKKMVGGAGTANPAGGAWRTNYGCVDDPDNGKPGYFTLKNARYIRYNGNGADNAEPYGTMTSHYLTNTGSLKANAYTRDGYTFVGWNTEADGSGTSYTDKQLMSDIVESKAPLTLYAQWEKNRTLLYNVANVGDYVEYKPTTTSYTPNSNSNVTGTIYPNTTTSWRVLSKNSDGTIDLISTNTVGTLTFGKSGYGVENNTYSNLDNTLEGISNSYINSDYAGSARIPSASDFTTIKNNGLTSSQNYILNKKDYESRSSTGDHEGGATWEYYIYYANGSTVEKFRIWYKYAGTGGQSSTGYSTTLGIRPIVRLKANLYTNDGTGTSGNSYKITN